MRLGKDKQETIMNSKVLLMSTPIILGLVSLVFLGGCGGGMASTVSNQPPLPAGAAVSPPQRDGSGRWRTAI